ncbi:unnamed protein product, partial [Nesidiocoris tenuis]
MTEFRELYYVNRYTGGVQSPPAPVHCPPDSAERRRSSTRMVQGPRACAFKSVHVRQFFAYACYSG